MDLNLPPIDYWAIAPILVLFGVACVGVLGEALLPRWARYPVQMFLAMAGLVAALVLVIFRTSEADYATITAGRAIAVDGPTLFLQGAIIVLGLVALLLISERSLETGGPFVAQAAVTAGSEIDRRQAARAEGATEV